VIVSNCVINLSIDKPVVLRGAFDLLKPGGELYFADVYCDRHLSDTVRADPVLYGECLGGALYRNDFLSMAKAAGFFDPRLVTSKPLEIKNEAMKRKLGQAKFFSATYRLFKLDGLEAACEDYGQAVVYKGSVAEQPDAFELDGHHLIETGKVFPVCGNTWRMLARYALSAAFLFSRRRRDALRNLPGLRHVDPRRPGVDSVLHQVRRRLLLTPTPCEPRLSFPRKRESSKRQSQLSTSAGVTSPVEPGNDSRTGEGAE
jgi:hypothetical protein